MQALEFEGSTDSRSRVQDRCTRIGGARRLHHFLAGFQQGAIESAEGTNVHLVTWEQFQEAFYERWFDAMESKLEIVGREVAELGDYFTRARQAYFTRFLRE